MARQPKPWFRADRKVWCVTIGGKRHNLGQNKKEAMRRFYAMMRQPRREKVVLSESLTAIIDTFLGWCQRNRSAATYRWYLDHLQSFVSRYPNLTVDQLTPLMVEDWATDGYDNVNTRRNRLRSVKRCLRWATLNSLIEHNPIVAIEIPSGQPRETYVSPEEFERLLKFVHDPTFIELLRVTYETGCRPQESLRLESRHCDLDRARWIFPRSESKVKSMPRVVYLSEYALTVSRRLAKESPLGPLFRNTNGKPWTPPSVNCAFDRIQTRMGKVELERRDIVIAQAEFEEFAQKLRSDRMVNGVLVAKSHRELLQESRRKLTGRRARRLVSRYSLYALRHAWATNALQQGVDSLTVAVLMGHSDPSMLARTYQHLSHNPEHLLAQARRVST